MAHICLYQGGGGVSKSDGDCNDVNIGVKPVNADGDGLSWVCDGDGYNVMEDCDDNDPTIGPSCP